MSTRENIRLIARTPFPSWAYEIAKPRPGMNIKVAAFTVTEKLYNTAKYWSNTESVYT